MREVQPSGAQSLDALVEHLRIDACFMGLFDADGLLVARPWKISARNGRAAFSEVQSYDVLFGADPPGYRVLRMQQPLGDSGSLRAALLLHEPRRVFSAHAEWQIRHALRALVTDEQMHSLCDASPASLALRHRHSTQWGALVVNSALRIEEQWWSTDARAMFDAESKQLPAFIESPLRAFLSEWDWSDPARCPSVSFAPVPPLVVRAFPLQGGTVRALVMVERVHLRLALERARREHGLSPRELDVIRLLFEGYRMEEIATELCVAESTVQDHVKRAIGKAGARNRVQLAARILGWEI